MDKREKELTELRDYGGKLLEKMKYPDIIHMLQGTMTYLTDIAREYAQEADDWHKKYDACKEQQEQLQAQFDKLLKDSKQRNSDLCGRLDTQREEIERLKQTFDERLKELRSYRDEEIKTYHDRVQSLSKAQETLDTLKDKVQDEQKRLKEKQNMCSAEQEKCEEERRAIENQRRNNQEKLDHYQTLFDENLKNKEYLNDIEVKLQNAQNEAAHWKAEYKIVHERCECLEQKVNARQQPPESMATDTPTGGESCQKQPPAGNGQSPPPGVKSNDDQ